MTVRSQRLVTRRLVVIEQKALFVKLVINQCTLPTGGKVEGYNLMLRKVWERETGSRTHRMLHTYLEDELAGQHP